MIRLLLHHFFFLYFYLFFSFIDVKLKTSKANFCTLKFEKKSPHYAFEIQDLVHFFEKSWILWMSVFNFGITFFFNFFFVRVAQVELDFFYKNASLRMKVDFWKDRLCSDAVSLSISFSLSLSEMMWLDNCRSEGGSFYYIGLWPHQRLFFF